MFNHEIEKVKELVKNYTNDFDIYAVQNKSFSTSINNQEVEKFSYADSKGLGIRVLKNKKVGYAYTEDFSDEALAVLVKEAMDANAVIEKEETLFFRHFEEVSFEQVMFNAAIEEVPTEKKIDLAKRTERLIKEKDERVFNVPYCSYSDGFSAKRIVNSSGLDKSFKTNYVVLYAGCLVKEAEEARTGFEFQLKRDFEQLNPEFIADSAVQKALDLLGGKSIEAKNYPVVFDQDAMAQMLATFCGIFNAKSVQEGKSGLAGKLNEKIGNELLSIYDDGRLEDGYNTSPFDDEGCATQKTAIVENGVLNSFLHNSSTAAKDGVKSTGNAARSFKSTVSVSPTNFYIKPGNEKKENLMNLDTVVEIVSLQGLHSGANPISGDFSLSAEGFVWKNGKRESSLKQFTVAGNFYKMLNEIDMIADNLKFSTSAIGCPSVRIRKLAISS